MVTTSSENSSFICVQDVCEDRIVNCVDCYTKIDQKAQRRKILRALWRNICLFFETDKWEHDVPLKVGDSCYMLKMDDIEARWRNLKP